MKRTTFYASATLLAIALPAQAISLDSFPAAVRVGRVDWVKIAPEGTRTAPFLSGSVLRKNGKDVNTPVRCRPKKCRHIELSDPIPQMPPVAGHIWEVGKDHMVKGGFGPLAAVNGGLEPSGYKVIDLGQDDPAESKFVIEQPSETSNTVVLRAYLRACIREPFSKKWLTCTPYFIPTEFAWTIKQGKIIPIDIKTTPRLNPIKPTKALRDKQSAIMALAGFAGSVATGATSGGAAIGAAGGSIIRSALQFQGASSADGPDGGNQACAFMVNKVIYSATGKMLGSNTNYVPSVEDDLRSGRGLQVAQSSAAPGDIIIAKGQAHIGICMNYGCTAVLSNSSSKASFSWQSGSTFGGVYDQYGGTERIYRLK